MTFACFLLVGFLYAGGKGYMVFKETRKVCLCLAELSGHCRYIALTC